MAILLISASQVARITGVSHQCLDGRSLLSLHNCPSLLQWRDNKNKNFSEWARRMGICHKTVLENMSNVEGPALIFFRSYLDCKQQHSNSNTNPLKKKDNKTHLCKDRDTLRRR
jgi:mannosyltransferase OCH1-like enzyme